MTPPSHDDELRWKKLQSLYHQALEYSPSDRQAFLAKACAGEPDLLNEIGHLLEHAETDGRAIQNAIVLEAQTVLEADSLEGKTIGAYRIEREIGQGGMGRVFLARRNDDTYQQTVAIKLLKTSTLNASAIALFEQERQTLARLSHVNVAVLLDGGTTENGIPYVVMQYVDGPRLDEFVSREKLDLGSRLDLFLKICAAVSHAHRNLVVHRDIKPSNVLVNAEGEPKLLDFGIAKILDEQSIGMTQLAIMTPPYASPEQIEGQPVTVQTDVYSLGALLYELLTGKPPFELAGSTPAQAAAAICNTMPALPSTAVTETQIKATQLQGDIDNIIYKAMRKEPDRRYPSVEALADDVSAYLEQRPVSARPDSFGYRANRFIARNLASVVVASLALVLLTGLVTFYTLQLRAERDRAVIAEQQAQEAATRANREAETSGRVSDFLVGLFDVSDPRAGARKDISARELLNEGQQKIQTQLSDEPGVKAHLMRVMGLAFGHMGDYNTSIDLLEQSLALRRTDPDSDQLDVAEALNRLAEMLRQQGELQRASDLHGEALAIRIALSTEPTWGLGDSHNNFGLLQHSMGNYAYAVELLTKAIDIHSKAKDSSPTSLGISTHNLALVLNELGQYEEADRTIAAALDSLVLGGQRERSPYAISLGLVARIKNQLADFSAAEAAMAEALAISERTYEPDNPRMGSMWDRVATTLCGQGRYDEAINVYNRALSIYTRSHGERSTKASYILKTKGDCLLNAHRPKEAEATLRAAKSIDTEHYSANHLFVGLSEVSIALALLDQYRNDEAVLLLDAALPKLRRSFEPSHPDVVRAQLGLALVKARRDGSADGLTAITALTNELGKRAPTPLYAYSLLYLAEAAACNNQSSQAHAYLTDAWNAVLQYAPDHPETPRFTGRPVTCGR